MIFNGISMSNCEQKQKKLCKKRYFMMQIDEIFVLHIKTNHILHNKILKESANKILNFYIIYNVDFQKRNI